MSELPKRKNTRLKNYDYSQNGAYFITICAYNNECLFGNIVGDGALDVPNVQLTRNGRVIDEIINLISNSYENIAIDKYVIMPNHMHMIVIISDPATGGTSGAPSPTTNMGIPAIVSTFKRFCNKKCESSLFQRFYHDRIIRNRQEYEQIWKYIDENPIKWGEDKYCAK